MSDFMIVTTHEEQQRQSRLTPEPQLSREDELDQEDHMQLSSPNLNSSNPTSSNPSPAPSTDSHQSMDLTQSIHDLTASSLRTAPNAMSDSGYFGRGAPPASAVSSSSLQAPDSLMQPASPQRISTTPTVSPSSTAAASSSSSSLAASVAAPVPSTPLVPLDLPPIRELPPIKLGKTPKERTLYEQLGDLYSLIVTTEHIESAYVRDAISEQAYTSTCSKLIAQYKTLRESMGSSAPDLESFSQQYGLECRAGENRLRVGIPATVVHGDSSSNSLDGNKKMEVAVFHAVQHFITMMDSLKLNMRAVDELHPTLTELVESINKVPGLPVDHESKSKTQAWLTVLHQMKAHEELTEEQVRQMSFDLDSAYNGFHRFVQGK